MSKHRELSEEDVLREAMKFYKQRRKDKDPAHNLEEEAQKLTAESIDPSISQKKQLLDRMNKEYEQLMTQHLEALEDNPELAEELIQKANVLREKIFAQDPKSGEVNAPVKADDKYETQELNRRHLTKNKTN